MDWSPCLNNGVASFKCIPILVQNVFNGFFVFIGIISVAVIFYAAFKFIRSRGDQAAIEEAKRTLTYGVVGLAVIFSAFIIVSLIASITGAEQIAKPLGTP